jgi:hypothetical protein
MTLDRQEFLEFIEVYLRLLYFVGQHENIISADSDFSDFRKLDSQIKMRCRDKLNENIELLDEYMKACFDSLSMDQIKILDGFKKKIESDFIIFRCFAKYAIFIDTADYKFYAVKALSDRFDKFFSEFPVLCHMTILPFKDKIIYDGFIKSKEIYFGKNMTMEMSTKYKQAKTDKTIITMIK